MSGGHINELYGFVDEELEKYENIDLEERHPERVKQQEQNEQTSKGFENKVGEVEGDKPKRPPRKLEMKTKSSKKKEVNGPSNGQARESVEDDVSNVLDKSEDRENAKLQCKAKLLIIILSAGLFLFGAVVGIMIGAYVLNSNASQCTQNTVNNTSKYVESTLQTSISSTPFTIPNPSTTLAPEMPCETCKWVNPVTEMTEDEIMKSLYATLTPKEMANVFLALLKRKIVTPSITLEIGKSNYVHAMYIHPPPKGAALKYLDKGGPFPGRYAMVHVIRMGTSPPDMMEYKVGPTSKKPEDMTIEQLRRNGEISINRRPYNDLEAYLMSHIVIKHLEDMKDLLRESFDDGFYLEGLGFLYSGEQVEGDTRINNVLLIMSAPDASTLRPLPVTCRVHSPGVNTSMWFASDFYYLNQGPFSSGKELMAAYRKDSITKFSLPEGYRLSHSMVYDLKRNKSLPLRTFAKRNPPRTYEPEGARYEIKGQKISWMGWSFDLISDPIRGPGVFNVKFKNERIAYEIALNDITLLYVSNSAGAGRNPAVLSDTEYHLGSYDGAILGMDCPARASKIKIPFWDMDDRMGIYQEAACVFEADDQNPIWRHTGAEGTNGMVDHYLVVRVPITVGNYDYNLSFQFHLDGRIEIIGSASGYLYSAFWDPSDPTFGKGNPTTPFGFRVGDYILGAIHDHSFLFKADLDIIDTENSFQLIKWKAGDVVTAMNSQAEEPVIEPPSYFPFNITRYIEYEIVEKESGVHIDTRHPELWTVINENQKNQWGVHRGYEIIPTSPDLEFLPLNHPIYGPWPNIKYHCQVTKRKDSEPYGSESFYDLRRLDAPLGGLDKVMDGENIRGEDLVLWVTAKFLHIPTSEDVPVTRRVDKGFILKPFNFFDRTATFDMPQYTSGFTSDSGPPYSFDACYEKQSS